MESRILHGSAIWRGGIGSDAHEKRMEPGKNIFSFDCITCSLSAFCFLF